MLSQTHHFNSSVVAAAASSALQFPLHHRQGMEWQKGEEELDFVDQFEFDFEPVKAGGVVDDFSIDDLLDFPDTNEDYHSGAELVSNGGDFEEVKVCGGAQELLVDRNLSGFSSTEISVPADDVAELEWLSNFVEDSFSGYSPAYSGLPPPEKKKKAEPVAGALTTKTNDRLFPRPLTKPRAKRSKRTTWSFPGGSISRSNTTSSSSSSSSGSTTSSFLSLRPAKRQNKVQDGAGGGSRRCSHCGVQKTPQWRAGPEGAKTLCNACGVRYKSGRLCPEYRPACSPTFSSELHSNQHRKVVEMRRKKEGGEAAPTATTTTTRFAPAVQSF